MFSYKFLQKIKNKKKKALAIKSSIVHQNKKFINDENFTYLIQKKTKIHDYSREAIRLIIIFSNLLYHKQKIMITTMRISHHPCAPVVKEDNFNMVNNKLWTSENDTILNGVFPKIKRIRKIAIINNLICKLKF